MESQQDMKGVHIMWISIITMFWAMHLIPEDSTIYMDINNIILSPEPIYEGHSINFETGSVHSIRHRHSIHTPNETVVHQMKPTTVVQKCKNISY